MLAGFLCSGHGVRRPVKPRGNPLLFALGSNVARWFPTGSTWKAINELSPPLIKFSLEPLLQFAPGQVTTIPLELPYRFRKIR